ncbi:MAG: hypothetical protein HY696_10825 [Deltaproteobacteria bacterium]|nr:hypothetical protein [Deltaproteobacteria bacterium]
MAPPKVEPQRVAARGYGLGSEPLSAKLARALVRADADFAVEFVKKKPRVQAFRRVGNYSVGIDRGDEAFRALLSGKDQLSGSSAVQLARVNGVSAEHRQYRCVLSGETLKCTPTDKAMKTAK